MKKIVKRRKPNRSVVGDVVIYFLLFLIALAMVFPLVFAVSSALKPLDELFLFPPKVFAQNPTMDNFQDLFVTMGKSWVTFSRYIFNTVFITVVGTAGHLIIASMGAFVLAGILYGFGSWLECNRMIGSGSAAYGQGWDMDAIAACVVGGVSFTGGIGKISGVVTGVLIFTALTYSLTILGIDTNLQFIFEGIIILAAVTLDCLKYVKKK